MPLTSSTSITRRRWFDLDIVIINLTTLLPNGYAHCNPMAKTQIQARQEPPHLTVYMNVYMLPATADNKRSTVQSQRDLDLPARTQFVAISSYSYWRRRCHACVDSKLLFCQWCCWSCCCCGNTLHSGAGEWVNAIKLRPSPAPSQSNRAEWITSCNHENPRAARAQVVTDQ